MMTSKARWLALAALMLMTAWPTLTLAQPEPTGAVNLRPRYVPGRTIRYAVWTVRQQTISRGDEQFSNQFEVDGEVDWTVERVNADGSAVAVMNMLWLTARITTPDGQVQFNDTRQGSGQTEPVHKLLSAMAGIPLRVELAADGTPTSVSGVDAIRRRAGDLPVPEDLDFLETATDLATLPYAPAETVAGKTWPASFTWTHDMGAMKHETRYELVNVESIANIPVANVNFTSRLRLEVDRSKLPTGGPQVDVRLLQGQNSGQIMFDLMHHEAVGRNTLQTQTVQVTVTAEGQRFTQTVAETIQSQALRIAE
jgi:hypothetical protein